MNTKIRKVLGIKGAWDYFKVKRTKDPYFKKNSQGYLTVIQREHMIEDLLKIMLE